MKSITRYIIGVSFILYGLTINAKTINVCRSCEVSSIKQAIIIAGDFDSIIVKKGIYKESEIIIDKPLTIIGNNYPVIDGESSGEIINIISDNVQIIGFKIINVGKSYIKDNAAIRVKRSSRFLIKENIFEDLFFGIYIEKSYDGVVQNNKIFGNDEQEYISGNGVQLWYSRNILVDGNFIKNVRDGIYLEFSDNCTITNNTSTKNIRYGLHFMFSDNDNYYNNNFIDNGAGVAVMFSKKINMFNNLFQDNWGAASYGLLLKEINDSEIKNNIFIKNTVGVNLEGSNRLTFENNDFEKNGWGVIFRGASYNNKFKSNNFINNSFDLSYNTDINDNSFNENYWSDYVGYDLNKDGYGDVPYRPVKLYTYIVNKVPETIVLLRSLFVELINFSEKVSPIFTPDNLLDNQPIMSIIR